MVEFVSIVNTPEFGVLFILVFEVSCIVFILGPGLVYSYSCSAFQFCDVLIVCLFSLS